MGMHWCEEQMREKSFFLPSSRFCMTLAVSLPLLVVDPHFTLTFAFTLQ